MAEVTNELMYELLKPVHTRMDRQDDQVQALGQFGLAMPDHLDLLIGRALDGDLAVAIAVGTGEDDDGCAHGAGV